MTRTEYADEKPMSYLCHISIVDKNQPNIVKKQSDIT